MAPRHTLAALLLVAGTSHASCGSSYCSVDTYWDGQGIGHGEGWQIDLRYSYSRADRWRAGSSAKAPGEPSGSGEEIENKRTVNQTLDVDIAYQLDETWSVALGVPYLARDHHHTLDSTAGPIEQQGKFSEIGDVRLLAGLRLDTGAGLRFGLKLPTGATDRTMTPPDPADPTTAYPLERSSQPGTGSTDAILGAYYYRSAPADGSAWFVGGRWQSALTSKDGFRPGHELALDVGWRHPVGERVSLMLQVNGRHRSRDTGDNANPASGGYSVALSPGFSIAVDHATRLYGFVQRPLIQYVNTDPADEASGQLAARWAVSFGLAHRF